ncbi:hypothetical protein IFM89_000483 [Coptis chinensis]|uniref:Transposase-associated domain-containing protein n=1 Tax=Coptis chinensis TaxID=261450 RepID=A0A835H5D4_9MAGN|nr:hypothetical protein IFM89_000483 [Coptis chinensis]
MESTCLIDKSWIDLDDFRHPRFIRGVTEFVTFASEHHVNKNVIPCSCRKCRNQGAAMSHDNVALHCFSYGFDKTYKMWFLHGEKEVEEQHNERGPGFQENVHVVDMNAAFHTIAQEFSLDNLDTFLGDDPGGETHISGASTSSSKETRGPSIGVSEELPEGYEKVIIKLNEWGQPDEPKEEVDHFITKLGHIARRDIPIRYDSWKPVRSHESIIPKAIKTLGRMYVFENIDTIDTDWTISKFQKAWKEYKHELFKKYVKDQPHSFAFSLRNTENRKQQKNSSCLGRKSAAVAKVEMAKEKGVPVSSITRLDQYMHNHKRKNGEHQDPELVEKLNDYTALHPESRETSVNDALTKEIGRGKLQSSCEAWFMTEGNMELLYVLHGQEGGVTHMMETNVVNAFGKGHQIELLSESERLDKAVLRIVKVVDKDHGNDEYYCAY